MMKIDRWNSEEREQKHYERRYQKRSAQASWLSAIATAVGVVGAGLAACYAYGAMVAAQRQAKAAVDTFSLTTRPWIGASHEKISEIDQGGWAPLEVQQLLTLKNFGTSPAINIRINSDIHLRQYEQFYNIQNLLASSCKAVDSQTEGSGYAIMPGEERDVPQNAVFHSAIQDAHFDVISVSVCVRYQSGKLVGHLSFEEEILPKSPEPYFVNGVASIPANRLIVPDLRSIFMKVD